MHCWCSLGDQWIPLLQDKRDALDDFVRLEIESAFRAKLLVIPVLIGATARMPLASELPTTIAELATEHAAILDTGRDFAAHANRLIDQIERRLATTARTSTCFQEMGLDGPAHLFTPIGS
jgi:hypothetical protein